MNSVAILLAAYNGASWIEEQIESILNQKKVNVTLFVSIDYSSDDTYKVVSEYKDDRIVLLPYGERFGTAAKNFFRLIKDVEANEYEFIGFSDQDDIWLEDKLIQSISTIKDTDSVAFSSNVMAFWESGKKHLVLKNQPQKKWDYLFESGGQGCTYLLNAEVYKNLRSFIKLNYDKLSKIWVHDWLIYAFVRSRGLKWTISGNPLVLYRQHESNSIGINYGISALIHRFKMVASGKWLDQSFLISNLLGLTDTNFILNWQERYYGLCYLSKKSFECRRSNSDILLFFLACIFLCVKKTFHIKT